MKINLPPWLRRMLNPHNLTKIELEKYIAYYGYEVGDFTYGFPKIRFASLETKLVIGKFCSIADQVEIFLGGNHRTDYVSTYPFSAYPKFWKSMKGITANNPRATNGDVTIGHDVWIGSDVKIMSGVTVGTGAVLGAGAVVAKSVPPYAIAVGNPARVIKYRFDEATRAQLLATKWWNLSNDKINEFISLLQDNDIQKFITAVNSDGKS